jgi:predicted methyltransferase
MPWTALARPEDPRLPSPADLLMLVDVYHHIDRREAYFRRLQSMLKPGGRVAIIDFNESSPVGPPKSERIAAAQVRAEMERAGYALLQEHGFLPNQYFLVFGKAR